MLRKGDSRSRAPRSTGQARPAPAPQPDVIVDFIFDAGLLFVSIQNIGERPALNVSVVFDQRLVGLGGKKEISDLPLFKNIEFLAPRKVITAFLDTSESYFARNEPTKISARVTFRNSDGGEYDRKVRHDLEIYREIGYIAGAPRPRGNLAMTIGEAFPR